MLTTETFTSPVLNGIIDKLSKERLPAQSHIFAAIATKHSTPIDELLQKSARKMAIPAGFITSSGNVYAYINASSTVRFTIDSGEGFAELTDKRICVFISPEDAAQHSAESLNSYNIAHEDNGAYRNITVPAQLPFEGQLKLVKKTETGFETIDASFIPKAGLIPVEKWSNADITGTHTYIGQKVASVVATRSAIILRMKTTGKKCGKNDGYFAEVETLLRN